MIRKAKIEDLPDILSLYQQLFPTEDYQDVKSFSKTWSKIMNDEKIHCFIAYEKNTPVATCMITIIPNLTRKQRPYAVIENVVTHENFRKKGYGKSIIEKVVEYAKLEQCYKIMLLSSSVRTGAHQFYEKIGFDGSSKKGFQLRIP
ncbi:MAG: GNAT family N-acetyltransferase [Candidatus Thermoplasmatota archaeon]|nr:GNAT family N-acetyltransferase [Candidatus Thermoplasmatota archaeon]